MSKASPSRPRLGNHLPVWRGEMVQAPPIDSGEGLSLFLAEPVPFSACSAFVAFALPPAGTHPPHSTAQYSHHTSAPLRKFKNGAVVACKLLREFKKGAWATRPSQDERRSLAKARLLVMMGRLSLDAVHCVKSKKGLAPSRLGVVCLNR